LVRLEILLRTGAGQVCRHDVLIFDICIDVARIDCPVLASSMVMMYQHCRRSVHLGTHLHFQLAVHPPKTHDMPGVVTLKGRDEALLEYLDPRYVLGNLY
jgi:hypothetical protein